jgi:hypothetical protein
MKISLIHNSCSVTLSFLAALVLGLTTSAKAQDTTYTWVTADNDQNYFNGTIVMDAPSGNDPVGDLSDVVSLTISDSAHSYTYTSSQFAAAYFSSGAPTVWNAQNIETLYIYFYDQISYSPDNVVYGAVSEGIYDPPNYFYTSYAPYGGDDLAGEWVNLAPVPEPSTFGLLTVGLVGALPLLRQRK